MERRYENKCKSRWKNIKHCYDEAHFEGKGVFQGGDTEIWRDLCLLQVEGLIPNDLGRR